MDASLKGLTINSLHERYVAGDTSPHEVFTLYQRGIEDGNKRLNAYRTWDAPFRPYQKHSSLLAGIPYAAKDNILVAGQTCTAGSKILESYVGSYDATVIARLNGADAQLLGKTNMDEFAMGSSGEHSAYGVVRNPHDPERVPGGSSAGSAAAVAADQCVFALGSDTGGSIRQPAALCGVVGLKPSYGRVSRHGLMALASSLDQIGPLTKNVHDAAEVLNGIAGEDRFDATSVPTVVPDFTAQLEDGVKGLRIGVPEEFFGRGLAPEVRVQVQAVLDGLSDSGADIVSVALPHAEYAIATYYLIMPSEASANLSRYDGIRYGLSASDADSILDLYTKNRAKGFGDESTRRIILGTYALSAGYFDAYYLQAQKVRNLIRRDLQIAFERVDVIAGPTTPTTAFRIGEKSDDPLAMYLSDVYTVLANLSGMPAISVPCGRGGESGLPVGFQLTGDMFDEVTVLRAAAAVERLGLSS